jgi:hypothetical protein
MKKIYRYLLTSTVLVGMLMVGAWTAYAGGTGFSTSGDNRPSAFLLWPEIAVGDGASGADTVIEITNTEPNGDCLACNYVSGTLAGLQCNALDYVICLTANQTVAWAASAGLVFNGGGPGGVIPPFSGLGDGYLFCYSILGDNPNVQDGENDFVGSAAVIRGTYAWGYNAIGYQAIDANGNGIWDQGTESNKVLRFDDAFYERPPSRLLFEPFVYNLGGGAFLDTKLALVEMNVDLFNRPTSGVCSSGAITNRVQNYYCYRFDESEVSRPRNLKCWDNFFFTSVLSTAIIGSGTIVPNCHIDPLCSTDGVTARVLRTGAALTNIVEAAAQPMHRLFQTDTDPRTGGLLGPRNGLITAH